MTRVLIEVRGGLVTNIVADGEIRINVIDHDSLDPEDLPEDLIEETDFEDIKDFQSADEIMTPEGLDAYVMEIIEMYKKRRRNEDN